MLKFIKAVSIVLRLGPEKIERLEKDSITDPLTGLLNRRGFQEHLTIEKERSERYGHSFLIVYVDMDNLKDINDSEGHEAGDKALTSLAKKIEENCRIMDFAARSGGDEFIVVFPETTEEEAEKIVERFRKIENVSVGYCQYSSGITLEEATKKAEGRMYEEKRKKKGVD